MDAVAVWGYSMKTFTKLAFLGIFAATGIIIAGATAAQDAPAKVADLEITSAFTKAMLPGQPVGGGYLTIKNTGKSDDMLVSVSSPASGTVELHEMAMQGEVMNLMFIKVKEPFKQGGKVPVTLTFEKSGKVDITLPIEAAGPGGHMHK
jgi:copper(I)-binding protein